MTTRRVALAGLALLSVPKWAFAETRFSWQSECSRQPNGRVSITWAAQPVRSVVTISKGDRPDGIDARLIARSSSGRWTGLVDVMPRPYFKLVSASGANMTAERVLPLEGGRNFRDLGGYTGESGRPVKWGVLYRSGTLSELTDFDYQYLNALGIAVICDLRSTAERRQEPTAWRGQNAPTFISNDYVADSSEFRRLAKTPGITVSDLRLAVIHYYARLPYLLQDNMKSLFGELVRADLPLTFHCSAGKDRTGLAAALILTALGVSRSDVLDDYSLSERIVDFEAVAKKGDHTGKGAAGFSFLANLSANQRKPLLRSDPDYIAAALDAIVTTDGSISAYLKNRLGVDGPELVGLKTRLLAA